MSTEMTAAGWYYIPGEGRERYFDGREWTNAYRNASDPGPAGQPVSRPGDYAPGSTRDHAAPKVRRRTVVIVSVLAMVVAVGGAASLRWASAAGPADAPVAGGDFAEVYKTVRSGVVRIQTSTCTEIQVGTGFLVGPNLVATAAHVVDGATSVKLSVGEDASGGTRAGKVVGIDAQADVALIETTQQPGGHVFQLAEHDPSVGQEVAAIGFPQDEPMTLTKGTVSGLGRTIPIEGMDRTGMIQTDVAINPGNSGGPMIASDGIVYGIIDAKMKAAEGIGYSVSPTIASARIHQWQSTPSAVPVPSCGSAAQPQPRPSGVTLPAGATDCPATFTAAVDAPFQRSASGNPNTSCPFAESVRQAYLATGAAGQPATVNAHSVVTGKDYQMSCSGSRPMTCVGGNQAVVLLY